MTNKRQLKKYIHNVCGDLASEILIARQLFDGYDEVAVEKVIIDIAALQEDAIAKVSFAFDKAPSSFENEADYRKALKAYRRTAFAKLLVDFDYKVEEIVKQMNAITPQKVRDALKG